MINTIKLVYSDIAVGAKENFNYHCLVENYSHQKIY